MTLANVAGNFQLEAAQQQLVVDQFSLVGGAFHVSLSPVVSSGNGGVHRLFEISGNKPILSTVRTKMAGSFRLGGGRVWAWTIADSSGV
jgi:hypothetical protein